MCLETFLSVNLKNIYVLLKRKHMLRLPNDLQRKQHWDYFKMTLISQYHRNILQGHNSPGETERFWFLEAISAN